MDNFNALGQIKRNAELVTIKYHLAFFFVSRESKIINEWYNRNIKKINYEEYRKQELVWYKVLFYKLLVLLFSVLLLFSVPRSRRAVEIYKNKLSGKIDWDYLGNSTFNPSCRKYKNSRVDLADMVGYEKFFPEYKYIKEGDNIYKYKRFYFENNFDVDEIINTGRALFLLHNSWTPEEYKNMDREDFLKQPIILSRILKKLLKI